MSESKVAKNAEAPKYPSSDTGGVQPMAIASRLVDERERLLGMTADERAWRHQWLRDQQLSPHEPVFVPAYMAERLNPIRRFYRFPLDKLFTPLIPIMGENAYTCRYLTGKFFLFGFAVLCTHYYFKYQGNDWTKKSGWRVVMGKPNYYPGDPKYDNLPVKTAQDYADRGFKSSPI